MRRVLLVSYFFPPLAGGGVSRALKLVKYLPDAGWTPHVLTVRDGFWSAFDPTPLAELPPEVVVHRTRFIMAGQLLRRLAGGGKSRPGEGDCQAAAPPTSLAERAKDLFRSAAYVPDEFVGWLPFAVRAGKRIIRDSGIEAIVSSAPPFTAHLVARSLARATGLPWLADFRDPWTDNPSFQRGQGIRGAVERRLERSVIEDATRIITVTGTYRSLLLGKYRGTVTPGAVHVIENGFDPEDFAAEPLPPELVPEGKRLRIVYTGGWMDDRSPRTFFAALGRYAADGARRPPLEVVFAGTEQEIVRAEAEKAGVSDLVRTVGFLPMRQACALQRSADVLLLTVNECAAHQLQISGKAYQYLGAGRPILALSGDGITRDLVTKLNAGIVVPTRDAQGAYEALCFFAEARARGEPVHGVEESMLRPYTRRAIAERLAQLLDEVS